MPIIERTSANILSKRADGAKPEADTTALTNRVATASGCITVLDVINLCYVVSGNEIDLSVKVVGITIGTAKLSEQNNTVTISGVAGDFTVEVTVTVTQWLPLSLNIKATACAPINGCTVGDINVTL